MTWQKQVDDFADCFFAQQISVIILKSKPQTIFSECQSATKTFLGNDNVVIRLFLSALKLFESKICGNEMNHVIQLSSITTLYKNDLIKNLVLSKNAKFIDSN